MVFVGYEDNQSNDIQHNDTVPGKPLKPSPMFVDKAKNLS